MLKQYYQIPLLVFISLTATQARFLQSITTTSSVSVRDYNQNLPCGECILGGYTFCIKGPEQYTGSSTLRQICCFDASVCNLLTDSSYSCTSKYSNDIDKFKVCPFQSSQCGESQNLTLEGLGDSECIRMKNLPRGNACLYRVRSQCGVPSFQVNDTTSNVIVKYGMISSTQVVNRANEQSCFKTTDQQCLCQPLSTNSNNPQFFCNCPSQSNITLKQSECACQTLKDWLGNTLQQCNCQVPAPIQVLQDQTCKCQSADMNSVSQSNFNCDCGSTVTGSPLIRGISLKQDQCFCLNRYDPMTKQPYYDCKCVNVPKCQDPSTYTIQKQSTCSQQLNSTDFPCKCAQSRNSTSTLICNCTNLNETVTTNNLNFPSTQCSCYPQVNDDGSWQQQCNCCLNQTEQARYLAAPIKCQGTNISQVCSCMNVTINGTTTNNCTCTHPTSNVDITSVINTTQCSFSFDTMSNMKTGNCCVSYDKQIIQMQPQCSINQTKESCRCLSILNPLTRVTSNNCSCDHPINNKTVTSIQSDQAACFCPSSNQTMKTCNCCVNSNVVLQQLQPACTNYTQNQGCLCKNITLSGRTVLNCDCAHTVTNVTAFNQTINQTSCYCNAFLNDRQSCNCCASLEAQITQQQPICVNNSIKEVCTCNINSTQNCSCIHPSIMTNVTGIDFSNSQSCFCNPLNNRSCNCCVSISVQKQQLQPKCNSTEDFQSCQCSNETNKTSLNCSCTNNENYVSIANINQTSSKCYCDQDSSNTSLKYCNCCSSPQVIKLQRQPICPAKSIIESCQCNYISAFNRSLSCSCLHPMTKMNISSIVVDEDLSCYCDKKSQLTASCDCCVTPDVQLKQLMPTCSNSAVVQNCSCRLEYYRNGTQYQNCNCTNLNNFVQALNVIPTNNSCYCDPIMNSTCYCCVGLDDQVKQYTPTCGINDSELQTCRCRNTTSGLNCNCTSNETNVIANNLTFKSSTNCSCQTAQILSQKGCNCCVSYEQRVSQLQPKCEKWEDKQQCQCVNTSIKHTRWTEYFNNCTCSHSLTKRVASNLTMSDLDCFCLKNSTNNKTCNCCVGEQEVLYKQLLPTCPARSQQQECTCSNKSNDGGFTYNNNCYCKNPINNATSYDLTFSVNECYCNYTVNGACKCCVSEQEQIVQLQPKCSNFTQKQTCQCTNSTNSSKQNCNCTHPANGYTLSSINYTKDQCYSHKYENGTSDCNCCVSYDNQRDQLAPDCLNNTLLETCLSCYNQTFFGEIRTAGCQCQHPITNNIEPTFDMDPSQCYCEVNPFTNKRECSCCVTPQIQYYQLLPVCPLNKEFSQSCQCRNVTSGKSWSWNCTCENTSNLVNTPNVTFTNTSRCYCNEINSTNNIQNCTCCVPYDTYMAQIQPKCSVKEQKQVCDCNLTGNVQKCTCNNSDNNISAKVDVESIKCACNRPNTKSCNCCVGEFTQYQQLLPKCSANTSTENCTCSNSTVNGNNTLCNCTFSESGLSFKDIPQNKSSCYCPLSNSTNKTCACCVSQASVPTSQFACPVTENIGCLCKNSSINATNYEYKCNCTNMYNSNSLSNNITVNNRSCFCQKPNSTNQSLDCACCLTPFEAAQKPSQCLTNQTRATCDCLTKAGSNASCNCTGEPFGYSMIARNTTTQNLSDCGCGYSLSNISIQNCECCTQPNMWTTARPICKGISDAQQCSCQNITNSTTNKTYYSCSCPNNKYNYNSLPLVSVSLNSTSCGCDLSNTITKNCGCCIPDEVQNQSFLSNGTCSNNANGRSNCTCAVINSTFTCDCTHTTTVRYPNLTVDASTCNCIGEGNNFTCKCCLPSQMKAANPVCPSTFDQSTCNCSTVFNNQKLIYQQQCTCLNNSAPGSTTVQNYTDENSCSCLDAVNGTKSYKNCECCVQKPLACPASIPKIQQCDCLNQTQTALKTWAYNCSCMRPDTWVRGYFTIDKTRCYCTGLDCQCCIAAVQEATQVSILTCPANTTQKQSCQCQNVTNTYTNKTELNCGCLRADNNINRNFSFNSTNCMCNNTNRTNCTCCISKSNYETQIPVLQCPFSTNFTQQACMCKNLTNNTGLDCNCTRLDNNVTKNFTFSNQTLCLCINGTNCSCCLSNIQQATQYPIMNCSNTQRVQSCLCTRDNSTGNNSCNCTRDDNNGTKNFQFLPGQCLQNQTNNTNAYNCCISQAQYTSIIPVLTCAVNNTLQNCSCTNSTLNNSYQCNCTRPENLISRTFNFNKTLCLCNDTGCSCCLQQDQVKTQVLTCPIIGGYQQQNCSCVNETKISQIQQYDNKTNSTITVNQTVSQLRCNCTKNETKLSNDFSFENKSMCTQFVNETSYTCCVSGQQQGSQWPILQCPAQAQQSPNCSCLRRQIQDNTNITRFAWQCSQCSVQYQFTNWTVPNLYYNETNCLCNSTYCSCCVSDEEVIQATEKQCNATQIKSSCSCSNFTNKTTYQKNYTCSCDTRPLYQVFNLSLIDKTGNKCLCRNSTNCSCCLDPVDVTPVQPQCSSIISKIVTNCTCTNDKECNCVNISNKYVYNYKNLKLDNSSCNCLSSQSLLTGQIFQNCSCCALLQQVIPENPKQCLPSMNSTYQACQCRNNETNTDNITCDCAFQEKSAKINNLVLNYDQCGCEDTNNPLKNCSCCVNVWHYRNSILPTCDAVNQQANCTCVANSNTTAFCACTQKQTNNITYVRALNLNSSQCGCWNETGMQAQNCSCCVKNETMKTNPQPLCTNDSLSSACECFDYLNLLTMQWEKNCNCTSNPTQDLMIQQTGLTFTDPVKCGCVTIINGTRQYEQCNCCAPKSSFTPQAKSCPVEAQNEYCDCQTITDPKTGKQLLSCNCTANVTNVTLVSTNTELSNQNCTCLNTTLNGRNYLNCTCCVGGQALFCQQASVKNSTNLGCQCQNSTSSNTSLKCDCSAPVNSTTLLFKQGVQLNASQCCCSPSTDIFTKQPAQACNCTQTSKPILQTCQCTSATNSTLSCACLDCNNRESYKMIEQNRCSCPLTNALRKECQCQVDFNGICPGFVASDMNLDEGQCDAYNRPKVLNVNLTSGALCNMEYEYQVAVIAVGGDSNIIMNMQSYQLGAQYLNNAIVALVAFLLIIAY